MIEFCICSRASTQGWPECARMIRGARTSSAIGIVKSDQKLSKVVKSGEDADDEVKDDDCQLDDLKLCLTHMLHDDDHDDDDANDDDDRDDDHDDSQLDDLPQISTQLLHPWRLPLLLQPLA